jgi:hypothetical protein
MQIWHSPAACLYMDKHLKDEKEEGNRLLGPYLI